MSEFMDLLKSDEAIAAGLTFLKWLSGVASAVGFVGIKQTFLWAFTHKPEVVRVLEGLKTAQPDVIEKGGRLVKTSVMKIENSDVAVNDNAARDEVNALSKVVFLSGEDNSHLFKAGELWAIMKAAQARRKAVEAASRAELRQVLASGVPAKA